jgi:non-heme chloroperoxidase
VIVHVVVVRGHARTSLTVVANLAPAPPFSQWPAPCGGRLRRVDATCDLSSRVFGLHDTHFFIGKRGKNPAPRPGTFAAPIARRAASTAILPIFAGSAFRTARAPLFQRRSASNPAERIKDMPTITTRDGTDIFYKDWGAGQPIVFSHGWPLSADDWDTQMLFFLGKGFRVVAHDRRGHGRSTQTGSGHDMDHYADDLAALTAHLDLKGAVHVGHSTGGGEVVHYLARHGESRVAKAAIISAVPPLMVKTASNPGGLPKEVFEGLQAQLAANRAQFYYDVPAGPFYGYNRPGAKPLQAVIWNWWRQGMMGGAKAHYHGIVAFSQTDFTDDLKKITVPVLVMHGDDDQIVPYADSAPLSAKLLKNGTLKTYKGFPHGMPTTEAETINADLLEFIRG